MPSYTTIGGERLHGLAERFYGRVDDQTVQTIAMYNPLTWDGQGVFEAGVEIFYPDEPVDLTPNNEPPQEAARARLQTQSITPGALPGLSTPISSETGVPISEGRAVIDAIMYRGFMSAPELSWRPQYGTQVWQAFHEYNIASTHADVRNQLVQAWSEDADRYEVRRLDIFVGPIPGQMIIQIGAGRPGEEGYVNLDVVAESDIVRVGRAFDSGFSRGFA